MHSPKAIPYAIIAALIGVLAIAGLLSVSDSTSAPKSPATTAPDGHHANSAENVVTDAALASPAAAANTLAPSAATGIPHTPSAATGNALPVSPAAHTVSSAAHTAAEPGWPRTITDSRGETTTLERRPQRIASLAPSATQILRAIGADAALVAIPREGSDPAEAADLVRLQVYPAPSPEAILSLQADLLVGADITSPAVAARLRALGLPLIILSGNDYGGILDDIARAGEATGHEATATLLRQMLAAQLDAVQAEVAASAAALTDNGTTASSAATPHTAKPSASTPSAETQSATTPPAATQSTAIPSAAAHHRPQTLLFIGQSPDYAAGRGSYAADLLATAGADNVALRLNQPWPQLSREFILEANPQVLIFTVNAAAIHSAPDQAGRSAELEAYLRSDPIWSQLQAVRNNRIYAIDQNLLSVPGPQVGEALARLRAIVRDAQSATE